MGRAGYGYFDAGCLLAESGRGVKGGLFPFVPCEGGCSGALGFAFAWTAEAAVATWVVVARRVGESF
jgi:hypothetical protein